MAVHKRRCASCRYFQTTQLAGNGWCTNPKRQLSSDVRILVRKDELACRNSWGNDLWVNALESADTEIPVESPMPAADDSMIPIQNLDDEITSVVASGTALHASLLNSATSLGSEQGEDVVVGEASLVPERLEIMTPPDDRKGLEDGGNPGAHDDQALRMEVMARGGNQDALQQARDRLRKRRTVTLKLTNPVEVVSVPDAIAVEPFETDTQSSLPELETPPPVKRPSIDRRDLNAHLATSPKRDRQSGLPPRAYNDPMPHVPASESAAARSELAKSRAEPDVFDSVPAREPGFDLPLMDAAARQQLHAEQERSTSNRRGDEELFLPEEQLSSYDLVLQRARAIRASTDSARAKPQPNVQKTTRGSRRSRQQPQPDTHRQPPSQLPAAPAPAPALMRHQPEPTVSIRSPRTEKFVGTGEIRSTGEASDRQTRESNESPLHKGFDVSMLISRSVSFRRQEVPMPAESDLTSYENSDVDDYKAVESPIARVGQLGPSFRRRMDFSPDRQERVGYPKADNLPSAATDSCNEFDRHADEMLAPPGPGYRISVADARDVEPDLKPQDELTGSGDSWGELSELDDSRTSSNAPATSGQQRDLYRPRAGSGSPVKSWNAGDQQRVNRSDTSSGSRTGYRIRTVERHERLAFQDPEKDIHQLDHQPGVAREQVAPPERQAPPVEYQRDESMDGWSFEPQLNLDLRDNRDMDAFRARLFNNPPFSSRPDPDVAPSVSAEQAERANDDQIQRVQPQSPMPEKDSPKDSLLRSRSFERQAQERDEMRQDTLIHSQPEPTMERNNSFDLRNILEHQGDALDMTLQLAPELARSCRTCRDFRPAETGDRGWCTNTWAFKHSQMVEANDLACQSTIGCWWLPYDEVWLPEARETSPTPRVAQMVTTDGKRKQSG